MFEWRLGDEPTAGCLASRVELVDEWDQTPTVPSKFFSEEESDVGRQGASGDDKNEGEDNG